MAHFPKLAITSARQPPTQTHPMVTHAEVGIVKPTRFNFHKSHISPLNKITLSHPNWHAAMYDEYNALVKKCTWMLVLKPSNANVVRYMWLFRHKYHVDGSLSRHLVFGFNDLLVMLYMLASLLLDAILRCLFIAMRKYDMQLLEYTHMVSCNPSRTPIDTESKLGLDGDPIFDPTLYHSLAGGLQSSVEAEYRGAANVVAEIAWIRNLLRELHFPLLSATLVYCDNTNAIYLSGNHVQHQRMKHIEIDIHFVRDMVTKGHVHVLHVSSRYQYVDIFTKGLSFLLFEEFRTSLSVRSSPAQYARGC
nr:NBS-containing resistance-like protein [Tanacetum cinerariifolium]